MILTDLFPLTDFTDRFAAQVLPLTTNTIKPSKYKSAVQLPKFNPAAGGGRSIMRVGTSQSIQPGR